MGNLESTVGSSGSVHSRVPPRAPAVRRLRVDALAVSVGLLVSNGASYLCLVAGARILAPSDYGALGSVMALLVVAMVPAMGVQTAVALHVAADRIRAADLDREADLDRPADLDRLFGLAAATAVAVTAAALLGAPVVTAFLHLADPWSAVWLALSLAPLTVLAGWHGILQGRCRFRTLATLVMLEGLGKAGGGLVGLLVAGTPTAVLAGIAIGSAGVAAAGWVICGRPALGRPARRPVPYAVHATQATLGLILLTNLDVVLARHQLPGAEAGYYALGVIITKVAYLLPQAVGVVALPRMADTGERGRVVLVSLGAVVALDAVVVASVAAAGGHVFPFLGGAGYGAPPLPGWPFATCGSTLAIAQILLYSRVAAGDRRATLAVWGAVGLEIVLVTGGLKHSAWQVAGAAVVATVTLAAAGLVLEWRALRAGVGRHRAPHLLRRRQLGPAPVAERAETGSDHGGHGDQQRSLRDRSAGPLLGMPEHLAGDRDRGRDHHPAAGEYERGPRLELPEQERRQ
jgi:O-antigen/teichoic acid export membrane protein